MVTVVDAARKDMDRWLGNGGMAIIGEVGGAFEKYGVDGEDLGWVSGTFAPSQLACNPHGSVQAGVHALILDASMNFAINAALSGRDRTQGTIEMSTELLRPALLGEHYTLRGDVVRLTRQIGFGEASLTSADGKLVSRSTATFLLRRDEKK
jgi:acyl-coenzyme A thioesterase PaaI-like protein